MAQHNEPVQQQLLGLIMAAVSVETAENGVTRMRVDVTTCDQHGKPWRDTAMFREHEMSQVAHAVLMAYEWIWGQVVPAQPDASSSFEIKTGRTKSGGSDGRH